MKLLDFGIAKLLDEEGSGRAHSRSLWTEAARSRRSSPLRSRCKASRSPRPTDVYALGVLLYLLASGRHPTAEASSTPADAMRALLETEPGRLGLGDLDNILAKALRKRPGERYLTAAALGDDLRRYLRQEPVSARADSVAYRAGKFLRRNRLAVTVTALVAAGLLGATIFSLAQMREARRQRDSAVLQRKRADAQVEFQTILMSQVGEEPLTMKEMLDRARGALEHQYTGDPRFLSTMLIEMSTRYGQLGDGPSRLRLLARAESLAVATGNSGDRIQIQCNRADQHRIEGQPERAWALLDSMAAVLVANPDPNVEIDCLQVRSRLAAETQRGDEAVRSIGRAIALQDSLGESGPFYTEMLIELGGALDAQGRWREAVAAFDRVLATLDSVGRGGELNRSIAQHNRALTLISLGETREAERDLHAALLMSAEGPDGYIHQQPLVHYAETALAQGLADSAEKYFRQLFTQAVEDTNRYWQGRGAFGLARAQAKLGRVDEARRTAATFARIAEGFDRVRNTDDEVPDSRVLAGWIALASGDTARAHASFAEALRVNRKLEEKRKDRLRPMMILASETALALGLPDSALRLAREAREIAALDSLTETRSARVGEARLIEGRALLAKGETTGAEVALVAALRALRSGAGDEHPRTREAEAVLQGLVASSSPASR